MCIYKLHLRPRWRPGGMASCPGTNACNDRWGSRKNDGHVGQNSEGIYPCNPWNLYKSIHMPLKFGQGPRLSDPGCAHWSDGICYLWGDSWNMFCAAGGLSGLPGSQGMSIPSQLSPEHVFDWISEQLCFSRKPLFNIMALMIIIFHNFPY